MEEIKKITKTILNFFDVEPEIKIINNDEELKIDILTETNAGYLIGRDGFNLKDLEYILQAILRKHTNIEKKVSLDINNYRYEQKERLKDVAKDTAQQVLINKKPVRLRGFNAYERRIIHMELSTSPNLITESEGEGENRCLIVKIYP